MVVLFVVVVANGCYRSVPGRLGKHASSVHVHTVKLVSLCTELYFFLLCIYTNDEPSCIAIIKIYKPSSSLHAVFVILAVQ